MKIPTIKLPILLKSPFSKKNTQAKASGMNNEDNSLTTSNANNHDNNEEAASVTNNSAIIKKPLIKLNKEYKLSSNYNNELKALAEKKKMVKPEMSSKCTSSKINIEMKKVEPKNYKKHSYNKSVPKNKSNKTVQSMKLSGTEVVKQGKSETKSGSVTDVVSSKDDQSTSSMSLTKSKRSAPNQKNPSYYNKNTKKEPLLNEKQINLSKKQMNSNNMSNCSLMGDKTKRDVNTNNVNEVADPVTLIKKKKLELTQRSKDIQQKYKQNMEELLNVNDSVIRRINTKEILNHECTFNTDAPPLFCENAFNISKLSPIENSIDAISSIVGKKKDEAISLLKTCVKNGENMSNAINQILHSLNAGDGSIINTLNENKRLQEEVLADLENALKGVLNVQS